ncbi:MAG: hypothetical protein PHQ54_00670 [Candidatus Omnitrophica bacterium]|nr:hypothetical protein [Candidatus Omnitrophota bacterium]
MKKIQKIGFIMLPSTFILVGLICLTAGLIAKDRTLKIMGATWLPMGTIVLLFIIRALKKEK